MASRIPPLLEPCLAVVTSGGGGSPSDSALVLLTGTVEAKPNWLVALFLRSCLGPMAAAASGGRRGDVGTERREDGEEDEEEEEVAVVLASFMRDLAFWADAAGRLGVDLELLAKKGRFRFVDGLQAASRLSDPATAAAAAFPGGAGAGGAGGAGGATSHTAAVAVVVESLALSLHAAVDEVSQPRAGERARRRRVVLILDQPDLLLAVSEDSAAAGMAVRDALLDLRERVQAAVVALAADEPLIAAQTTTLERAHAAFALSLAHQADLVASLRLLDTGAASDVSGVMRITRGGGGGAAVREGLPASIQDHEYLYHVGVDGGVRVFERGQ